jgi:hypothetical protein
MNETTSSPDVQTRWKFLKLNADGQIISAHDSSPWQMQEWRVDPGDPKCCASGFHCSKRALDTMEFVDGQIMALVEVAGRYDEKEKKEAWERMRIIRAWRWTKNDYTRLAVHAAKSCLHIFEKEYPDDKRPRACIETTEAWLENPTEENRLARAAARAAARGAARDAAWDAAWAAAWDAAWDAAWAVARDAAWDAAWAVARDAAWAAAWAAARDAAWDAARDAAWDAAWDAMNTWLEDHIQCALEAYVEGMPVRK